MGLFHQNFDKPGPGVSPNAPRKKGAARYFEVLARDFSTFWMAGLLAMISSLPFALGLWFAVTTHSLIPMLLAGILGGMLAAPQIVGLNDTVLRALRDEPGYWWVTYRRAHGNATPRPRCCPAPSAACCWRWRSSPHSIPRPAALPSWWRSLLH